MVSFQKFHDIFQTHFLPTFNPIFIRILSTFYSYFSHILPSLYLHFAYILPIYSLFIHFSPTFYTDFIHMLPIFYPKFTHIFSTILRCVTPILSTFAHIYLHFTNPTCSRILPRIISNGKFQIRVLNSSWMWMNKTEWKWILRIPNHCEKLVKTTVILTTVISTTENGFW